VRHIATRTSLERYRIGVKRVDHEENQRSGSVGHVRAQLERL
jgi:hypothetical protein